MEFRILKEKLANNFATMLGDKTLFEVDVDKDILWNLYLDSFPSGTNPIYRERRVYDCSCCRQFIRTIGGTVFIDDDLNVHSIFEFDTESDVFQPVMDALDRYVKSKAITDVFLHYENKVGTDRSRELLPDGVVKTWDHFFVNLPKQCVAKPRDIDTMKGRIRDRRNVFKRSLDEISMDAIDVVLELILSNTLYKGEEWKTAIQTLKSYKEEYELLPEDKKGLYAWNKAMSVGVVIGKIRNHSIGVLLTDITLGSDLDSAVKRYERIVAPSNYKRPKAIFTKKMLEDAKKTITELGYMDSLQRRFATLDDITVNNILFSNKDVAKRMTGSVDIFDDMKKEVAVNPKKFSKVEEISVQNFIENVLPTATEIEAFVENKHASNFVSMIAPVNKEAKNMFKWGNPLSWAYAGNITDSDMKQNVKAAGGNVDGVLRFSIQWNEDGLDNCDLDAHCVEPDNNRIYFGNCRAPRMSRLGGQLDVDIIHPCRKVAVENITWLDRSKMQPGLYRFGVHQFSGSVRKGFRAEIEFDGEIHQYDYSKSMRTNEMVPVANVLLDPYGNFTIVDSLKGNSSISSREVWGVNTNQFVPVSVVSYSPNYFDEQDGIGHRHLFFFLKDCVNPEEPHGFYNEFLKNELTEHKRVFEALGGKCHVEATDDQLSGLGFSMTKRAELIVKVKGSTERVMKIKF